MALAEKIPKELELVENGHYFTITNIPYKHKVYEELYWMVGIEKRALPLKLC